MRQGHGVEDGGLEGRVASCFLELHMGCTNKIRKTAYAANLLIYMVATGGLEPPTPAL